jgi:GntR family transcriptional regulator
MTSPRTRSTAGHARRVRDLIRSRLLDGEFSINRLPDEATLMAEYRASRNVVRTALAELAREGLVTRVQGAGTFAVVYKTRHTLQGAKGLNRSVSDAGARTTSRLVAVEEVAAPLGVALRLGAEAHTACLVVDIVADVDDEPAMFLTSYLADPGARRVVSEAIGVGRWEGDWYDLLTGVGLVPTQRDVVAEAAGVDPFIAPHVGLAVGDPVMRFERRLLLGPEAVPEYGFSFCRGDRFSFAVRDGADAGAVR